MRTFLSVLFVTSVLTANIVAVKILQLPFGLLVPGGILVFPLSYALNDVLSEVYGFAEMRTTVLLGFVSNLMLVGCVYLCGLLPSPSFWTLQGDYNAVLGFTARLLVASFSAYLVGQTVNAKVLTGLKALTRGRWLWTRTIGSTAVGEGLDTGIFITIAFFGVLPIQTLVVMVLSQWVLKVGYEVVATPLTYLVVGVCRKHG